MRAGRRESARGIAIVVIVYIKRVSKGGAVSIHLRGAGAGSALGSSAPDTLGNLRQVRH